MGTQQLHSIEDNLLLGAVGGIVQWQRFHHAVERAAEGEVLTHGDGYTSLGPKLSPGWCWNCGRAYPIPVYSQYADDQIIPQIAESVYPVGIRFAMKARGLGIDLLGLFCLVSEIIAEGGYVPAYLGNGSRGCLAGSLGRYLQFQQDVLAVAMVIGDMVYDLLPAVDGLLCLLIPAARRESTVATDYAKAEDVAVATLGYVAIEAAFLRLLGLGQPGVTMGCKGYGVGVSKRLGRVFAGCIEVGQWWLWCSSGKDW